MTEIDPSQASERFPSDPYEACLLRVLAANDKAMSRASLRSQVIRLDRPWTRADFVEALSSQGFQVREQRIQPTTIGSSQLPALVALRPDQRPGLLLAGLDGVMTLFDPASGERGAGVEVSRSIVSACAIDSRGGSREAT